MPSLTAPDLPEESAFQTALNILQAFLAHNAFAPSTATVYTAMFRKFIAWLHQERNGKAFTACTWADIEYFAGTLGDRRLPLRYAVLIRDVFNFLRDEAGYCGPNPAAELLAQTRVANENDARHFLSLAQRTVLIACLEAFEESEQARLENGLRDAAIVGLITGGGVRVPLLSALMVNCVTNGANTLVMADKAYYEAPILPFALGVLATWARTRAADEPLFPRLHHASVFRLVVKFLVNAGIAEAGDRRMGPQTLRNTYAALLIDKGYTDGQLKMALGLNRLQSATLLRQDYAAFSERSRKDQSPQAPECETSVIP